MSVNKNVMIDAATHQPWMWLHYQNTPLLQQLLLASKHYGKLCVSSIVAAVDITKA